MKTLSQIYYSHKDWLEYEQRPNFDIALVLDGELADEADKYVRGLAEFKGDWKNVLFHDIAELAPYNPLAKALHISGGSRLLHDREFMENPRLIDTIDKEYSWNKHVDTVELFFDYIGRSFMRYFGEEIDIIHLAKILGGVPPAKDTNTPPTSMDADIKDSRKIGRTPAQPFRDYFYKSEDADIILPILHELLDGERGTARAKYIVAIQGTWIKEPAHQSVHNEFNNGRKDSTYETRYKRHFGNYEKKEKMPFSESELEDVRKLIQSKIPQQKAE